MEKILKFKFKFWEFNTNIFKDDILKANFISNLFFSMGYPAVHLELMSHINEKMIAMNSILMCISGIIFSYLWNEYSDKLYSHYKKLLVLETGMYITLTILFLTNNISPLLYYLIDTFIFALLSKNVICGINKMKSNRYKNEKREKHDNNSVIVGNSSSLIGFFINIVMTLNIETAFLLMGVGVVVDNIFYYKICKEEE